MAVLVVTVAEHPANQDSAQGQSIMYMPRASTYRRNLGKKEISSSSSVGPGQSRQRAESLCSHADADTERRKPTRRSTKEGLILTYTFSHAVARSLLKCCVCINSGSGLHCLWDCISNPKAMPVVPKKRLKPQRAPSHSPGKLCTCQGLPHQSACRHTA